MVFLKFHIASGNEIHINIDAIEAFKEHITANGTKTIIYAHSGNSYEVIEDMEKVQLILEDCGWDDKTSYRIRK